MNKIGFLLFLILNLNVLAQSFSPAPGEPGSTAIHKDSSVIVVWANGITLSRGYLDISQPQLGIVDYGDEISALGPAEGDGTSVVSLGDSGVATLSFPMLIWNGQGPDFAVFENGFADNYMEFAHVEVSSDGINFFRFPSVSETQTNDQFNNFTFGDCRMMNNLAGKYRQGYGTPFDLEDLVGTVGLNLNSITHVRLVDVVGSIDPQWGSIDSYGNLINDPYPTDFGSGGFDLDAVAVLNGLQLGINEELIQYSIFPNPGNGHFKVIAPKQFQYSLHDAFGRVLISGESNGIFENEIEVPSGVYIFQMKLGTTTISNKIHVIH